MIINKEERNRKGAKGGASRILMGFDTAEFVTPAPTDYPYHCTELLGGGLAARRRTRHVTLAGAAARSKLVTVNGSFQDTDSREDQRQNVLLDMHHFGDFIFC